MSRRRSSNKRRGHKSRVQQGGTTTVISNVNIHQLVRDYVKAKSRLPEDLREVPIGDWDVSRVTSTANLFMNYTEFNEPLNDWNVSNVKWMDGMFKNCTKFDQPLDKWDVSKVTEMQDMFLSCTNFDRPLDNWKEKVSNVTNMRSMFGDCAKFNQPLENWNVSHVTTMRGMFAFCHVFDQPLNRWNVENVRNMQGMFYECTDFNQPLNDWNVSNVRDFSTMFVGCRRFNQPLNQWVISNRADTLDKFVDTAMTDENKPRIELPPPPPPQVDALQVHRAASKINYDTLLAELKKHLNNQMVPVPSDADVAQYIHSALLQLVNDNFIDAAETKTKNKEGVDKIMSDRLSGLNYGTLHASIKTTSVAALEYVKLQPREFQEMYIDTFVKDCVEAYNGSDGMTCAQGALERLMFSLVPAAQVGMTMGTFDDKTSEWNAIVDIITASPSVLIDQYIKDWYKEHKKGTAGAFAAEVSQEQRKASLKAYLLGKLPSEETLVDQKIAEIADNIGYEDDDFEVLYGGRRRRRRATRKIGQRRGRITRRKRRT